MKVEKIMKSIDKKITQKLPIEVATAKNLYKGFVEKMSKSDFANSPRRYIMELDYLKQIKTSATRYKLSSEVENAENKIIEITSKLKNEFGITFNN